MSVRRQRHCPLLLASARLCRPSPFSQTGFCFKSTSGSQDSQCIDPTIYSFGGSLNGLINTAAGE